MTSRTIMAVVSDLIKTGLTVEQQMLVSELVIMSRTNVPDNKAYERARKRAYRANCPGHVPDKESTKESIYINNKPFGKGVETPFVPDNSTKASLRSTDTNPRALGTNPRPPQEPEFEKFWNNFPRKIAKGAARKAYRNAAKRAAHEEILAGAKRYAASKPEPQFTKHPATWLNSDCWLDEPEKPKNCAIVTSGPWKPVEREKPMNITEEERQANLAKLASIRFKARSI